MTKTFLKEFSFLSFLFIAVLLLNWPVFNSGKLYYEYPPIYLANQQIHSLKELFQLYLHPIMLYGISIPWFRPSGHFLIYQLITPFTGWHNINAFTAINLFFLACTGYMIIKLYQILFPTFKVGGYIAFALYLMHPALVLQHVFAIHFDFAHAFFVVLSLYCFIIFCQKNNLARAFHHFNLFLLSLIFFIIAVTFKESAAILGLVLISYLLIYFSPLKIALTNRTLQKIILIILLLTTTLGVYLSLQWEAVVHPFLRSPGWVKFFYQSWWHISHLLGLANWKNGGQWTHQSVYFPFITRIILWINFIILITVSFSIFKNNSKYKKSLTFLLIASLIFMIIPVVWGAAMPWHLNLMLIPFSLVSGFCIEFLLKKLRVSVDRLGILIALLITLMTPWVIHVQLKITSPINYLLTLNYNALFHPPAFKKKLNSESILLVEDSQFLGDYQLGDSFYPYTTDTFNNYTEFLQKEKNYFLKAQLIYNGTLFRWAYLMPTLKEEVFPFQIDHLSYVSSEHLYNWITHIQNIFCVGYDKKGNWYDKTARFKKKLIEEVRHRHLNPYHYLTLRGITLQNPVLYTAELPYPNEQLCQLKCDQTKQCKGFTYAHIELFNQSKSKCWFYQHIVLKNKKPCPWCTSYIKN